MIQNLPKEILDQIFILLNPGDHLSFILTCKSIYEKVYPTLFRIKPIELTYCPKADKSRQLSTTSQVLRILENRPELYKECHILHIALCSSKHLHHASGIITRNKNKNNKSLSLIDCLSNFHTLRFLKLYVYDLSMLKGCLEHLPGMLTRLTIVVNHKKLQYKDEDKMLYIKTGQLKYVKVTAMGKEPLLYDKTTMRSLVGTHVIRAGVTERTIDNTVRRRLDTSNKVQVKSLGMNLFGELVAKLLRANQKTIKMINIKGVEGNIVFSKGSHHSETSFGKAIVQYPKLKIIKLCGLSIKKIDWWLPELERVNKTTTNVTLKKRVAPVVIIKSMLFRNQESYKFRFFGSEEGVWSLLEGVQSSKFWNEFCYK